MVDAILPHLFRIEIPLPGSPLKSVNSYVMTDGSRNVIVDTGMNRPECQDVLGAAFKELALDPARTDFFISHFHSDHLGLVAAFATATSRVYLGKPEADFVAQSIAVGGFREKMAERARIAGFPEAQIEESIRLHPGFKYGTPKFPNFTTLRDSETFEAGEYAFTCIHTPGHTPGHFCLYEPRHKILISGDHVLGDITPNIPAWADDGDMLGEYLASLDKINVLDVDLVLPGHRRTFTNFHERIQELKRHHQARLEEVHAILKTHPGTAYDVASRMEWQIVAESWDTFPIVQKWFAVGEASAHLIHLEAKNAVRKAAQDGVYVYDAL